MINVLLQGLRPGARKGAALRVAGGTPFRHVVLREGDTFVVWRLDRLGRNLADLVLGSAYR